MSAADMFYWMGMEEGGDVLLFEEGLRRLEQAAEMVELIANEERGTLPGRIESLRVELEEQLEMAHDTMNGALPLFRYLTGRGRLNEWVDDPWVTGAVRGADTLSGTAARYWMPMPQLDVFYGSSVRHLDDETAVNQFSYHPALENEMSYIFNLNGRFSNHNRAEVRGALNEAQWKRYLAWGMDPEHARALASTLSLDHVLEVRLQEVHVEDPFWFYQVMGRLRDGKTGHSVGTVFASGMVRDLRGRLPWLPAAALLPCLLAMVAAGANRYRMIAAAAFLIGMGLTIPLLWLLSPRLAPGHSLLVVDWWAPFTVALGMLVAMPMFFFLLCRKFPVIEQWFFCTPGQLRSSALGIAAAPAAILGFSALSVFPSAGAAVSLVPLFWLAFLPFPVMLFKWAANDSGAMEPSRERLLALTSALWIGAVWWMLPESDRSFAVNAMLFLFFAAGIVGAWFAGRGAFVPVLLLSAGGSFGAALTGNLILILPWSLAGGWILFGVFSRSRGAPAVNTASRDGRESALQENWLEREWMYYPHQGIEPLQRFLKDLAESQHKESGRRLHVWGPEGSGKSRMIEEVLTKELAERSIFTISCRKEKDGIPFDFLVRGFERAKVRVPSWLSGDSRLVFFDQFAGSAASILPGAEMISAITAEDNVEGLSPPRVASWVVSFFVEKSNETGTVGLLWIDDADNLSGDEWEFIDTLLDQSRLRETRLALVTSSRGGGSGDALRVDGAKKVHRVQLEWSDEEMREYLEATLTRECVDAMMEKTSLRVPGFFMDWANALVEQGVLEKGQRGWEIASREGGKLPAAPQTVLDSAGAILKALDEDSLDLLRVAACDDMTFHAGCVAAGAGRTLEDVVHLLERCEEKGIIIDLPEDRWFRFRDELTHEFLCLRAKRDGEDSYRQRYAMALERMAKSYRQLPDREMKGFERLSRAAGHYKSAGIVSEEGVRCRLELVREALDRQLFGMAAQNAEVLLTQIARLREEPASILEAGALYLRALSLHSDKPLMQLFDFLQHESGENEKMAAMPSECAVLVCEVARTMWRMDGYGEGTREENLRHAQAILEGFDADSHDDVALRIRLWHYRGRTAHYLAYEDAAKLRAADQLFLEALRIEASSPKAKCDRAEALTSRAICLSAIIELEKATASQESHDVIELLDESIMLKSQFGDRLGKGMALGAKGRFFLSLPTPSREELEEALRCFEENEVISQKVGNLQGQLMMPSLRGKCLLKLKRYGESIREYRRALKIAESLGRPGAIAWARLGLVQALREADSNANVIAKEMDALLNAAKKIDDSHFNRELQTLEAGPE